MGQYDSCHFACVEIPTQFAPAIIGQYGDEGLRPFDPVIVVGNALVTTLSIVLILWTASRLLPTDDEGCPSRGPYLLVLLCASVVGGVLRIYALSPVLDASPWLLAQGIVPNTLRMFLSVTIVQSISGMLTLRYARQAAVATTALLVVVEQQQLVVESDERARRSIAEFLHDRVQADLLVVALHLRAVALEAEPSVAERLDHAIGEIERIRSSEVRSASRRLSPAFGSVGLDTALEDLADSWETVMPVSISFDEASGALLLSGRASPDLRVAVYRIVEQALLNAASHGAATRADVALRVPKPGHLLLTVTDDGRGLPSGMIQRGAGTAIMDAWCSVAHGTWSWSPAAPGVRLQATFDF